MAKQSRIEPISSRQFQVIITPSRRMSRDLPPTAWYVRARETCADTAESSDWEAYRKLKRVWRKSKEDFDSACRFMEFKDLFSTAGVEL